MVYWSLILLPCVIFQYCGLLLLFVYFTCKTWFCFFGAWYGILGLDFFPSHDTLKFWPDVVCVSKTWFCFIVDLVLYLGAWYCWLERSCEIWVLLFIYVTLTHFAKARFGGPIHGMECLAIGNRLPKWGIGWREPSVVWGAKEGEGMGGLGL